MSLHRERPLEKEGSTDEEPVGSQLRCISRRSLGWDAQAYADYLGANADSLEDAAEALSSISF